MTSDWLQKQSKKNIIPEISHFVNAITKLSISLDYKKSNENVDKHLLQALAVPILHKGILRSSHWHFYNASTLFWKESYALEVAFFNPEATCRLSERGMRVVKAVVG